MVTASLFGVDRDIDITDKNGEARLLVKSLDPGEQWIHVKYRDKGTGGAEGLPIEYVAEVQWFSVDIATFDNPATVTKWVKPYTDVAGYWDPQNEAVSTNEVGTTHKFDFWVYGLKLEYFPSLWNGTQSWLTQTPWIDTDAAGTSYDGVMDAQDAAYLGGIFIVNEDELDSPDYTWTYVGPAVDGGYDPKTGLIDGYRITHDWTGIKLGAGGITEFDFDGDGSKESAAEMYLTTGIYLPLQNKGVDFEMYTSDSATRWNPGWFTPTSVVGSSIKEAGVAGKLTYAGVDYTYDAITDASGHAYVTVTSTAKGLQYVDGVVDYPANPAKGNQRTAGRCTKTWTTQASPTPNVTVTIDGVAILPGQAEGPNPVITSIGALNDASIQVHVRDAFGNELADYEVVYEIVGNGQWKYGTQAAADTFHPWQYLADNTPFGEQRATAKLTDRYPSTNPVTNSALNQMYEKLTSIGTTHSGTFEATIPTALIDQWSWSFTASGLFRLPVTVGSETMTQYELWLDTDGDNSRPRLLACRLQHRRKRRHRWPRRQHRDLRERACSCDHLRVSKVWVVAEPSDQAVVLGGAVQHRWRPRRQRLAARQLRAA